MGLALKPAVVPAGRPVTLSETLCTEPLVTVVLTVAAALPPGAALILLGATASERSFVVAAAAGSAPGRFGGVACAGIGCLVQGCAAHRRNVLRASRELDPIAVIAGAGRHRDAGVVVEGRFVARDAVKLATAIAVADRGRA